jgi:small GTP-binding protein
VQYQAGCNHWSVPFSSSALHREAMDSSSSSSSDSTNSRSGNHTDGEAEYGLFRLLTKETRSLLHEQRRLTEASRQVAAQVMALGQGGDAGKGKGGLTAAMDCSKSTSFLEDLRLESTFSVVIAGEFNAGKSTLINALLGRKLLETGALPTTDSITIVAGSDYYNQEFDDSDNVDTGMRRSAPLGVIVHSVHDLPLLEDLTLIDSPGTNSTWMDHTERTMRLLPAADMILFVTSADRPFSESERTLLKSIEAYRKSIVVVINKMDILDLAGGNHGEDQKKAVVDFVTDRASELLGARPVVIPISARDALSAKLMAKTITTTPPSFNDDDDQPTIQHRSNVWTRSNFFALESFLKESLTAQARLKSKLSNPLGVTDGVMNECISIIRTQRDDLQVDVATLNIFQSQFEGWKKELIADLTMSRSAMTDMVRHEGQRCQILTSRMTWYNFYYWVLVDTPSLYKEWEETKREITIFRHQENLKAALVEQVLETA